MFTESKGRMDENSETSNDEAENIRKYQTEATELKNTKTELKNTLQEFDSRLDLAEKVISELQDKAMELNQKEQ